MNGKGIGLDDENFFLKMRLKINDWTDGIREGGMKVRNGLHFRTGILGYRRRNNFNKVRTDRGQILFESLP